MTSIIQQKLHKPAVSEIVSLFSLDATNLGAPEIVRFCSSTVSTSTVSFDGNLYLPIPIDTKGFERTASGELPRPTIKVGNVNGVITGMIITYRDLVGAKLTRIKTLKEFLDGQNNPDPTQVFMEESYIIQQKKSHNKLFIEFQLTSVLDQETEKLPRRIAVADYCSLCYRRWNSNTATFEYAEFDSCPYAGNTYVNEKGEVVADPKQDKCGKKLSDCKQRFGNQPLPGTFFPGMRRIR